MKILHVIPFFTPARGGSVIVPYYLSKELSKKGHDVTLITSDFEFDEGYAKSIEKNGVNVIPFHSIANIKLFLISPSMKKWVREKIKKFDVVHIHNFRSYQNVLVYRYSRKYGVPYVLQAHGSVLPFFQRQKLKKFYDFVWGNKILEHASKIIALTNNEKKQYTQMGVKNNKIVIIPNGIDLAEYDNLPPRGEYRRKIGIKDDEKIILYLGRIHKIKGIDLLVNAFADLVTELDNVRLVIAGPDDGFLPTLKKQIEDLEIGDKILFTGPLYGRDKLEVYVDADVYVLPSVYEIFGITVLEAWACGTPVIVTDRCGIADFVEKAGYVVEYDKSKLRDAIIKILGDEGVRIRFEAEGWKLLRDEFGWDRIIPEIEKIYSNLMEK